MADSLSLQTLLTRLRPGDTPIFKHTKETLLDLIKLRDELSARQLARVILSDPLATLRVIYQANNRSKRSLGGEIATVEHAVMMQGVLPFLNMVADIPVLEDTPSGREDKVAASLYRLLRIAQHAAWQARDFCVLKVDTRAEEVEVAALLYYVPDLLFWIQARDIASQLAKQRRKMRYDQAEIEVLGFPLAEFRLAMMSAWKVPEAVRDLFDPKIQTRPRQIILKACLDIAHRSRHGWWDEHLPEDYLALADAATAPLEQVASTVHLNAVKVARYGSWIPSPPAAAWLTMEPGPWPPEADDDEEDDRAETMQASPALPTGAQTQDKLTENIPPQATGETCLIPDKAVFKESLRSIETHLDGSMTLTQMSAQILRGLHTGLGLSRMLFAMLTPDGQRIKVRFSLGIPAQDPLRHFEFELQGKDLFCQLMSKPQGIWLNNDNRAKLWPRVAPKLQAMIGEGDFYAMSLYTNNKPSGLIYADRGHGACGLDAHTYTDFKIFCLMAARGLSKLKAK